MNSKWKVHLENALFVVTILLLILLIFEQYLELPYWFQPLGRMHPLVLHFPITLLLLVFIFVLVPKAWFKANEQVYFILTMDLLLVATILAGLTAISGLFLSLEDGYDPDALFWHKYLTSGIVLLSSVLYWLRKQNFKNQKVPQVIALSSLIVLTLGAHKGADITHGEGFLLGDLGKKEKPEVAFEDALVFQDVVLPILEDKCITCHNNQKAKGELIMTSFVNLRKGGKSGAIITAGHPETSTLAQRLLLPMDNEEHMPPSGKPQLTGDEIAILNLWIQQGAADTLQLASLPAGDSLRVLAKRRFEVKETKTTYDFDFADADIIENLNNPYRVVAQLAKESPALEVSFFGSKEFSSEKLDEILEVKEQVVSLQLNKIPVKDEDLKSIKQLENLEQLNINFSEITSNGLDRIAEIPSLRKLSIAGIAVSKNEIEELLKAQKGLKTLHAWNTNASQKEINELNILFPDIEIIGGRQGLDEMLIQLNQPFIGNNSAIFKDSLILELEHPIKGVEMKLALNNQDLDSINGLNYKPEKIVLKESKQFKAKAFKEGWLASEAVTLNVYQNKYDPDSVMLLTKLNRVHPASGSNTFFDKVLGKNGANNPAWANNWAGFRDNDMVLVLEYDNPVSVSSISMNLLIESETRIFPPESIEIWGGDNPNQLKLLGKIMPKQPKEKLKGYIELVNCPIKPYRGKYFKVIAKPVQRLPKWISRNGGKGLFLVDELFVN